VDAAVSKNNTGAFMFSGTYAEITAKNGEAAGVTAGRLKSGRIQNRKQ